MSPPAAPCPTSGTAQPPGEAEVFRDSLAALLGNQAKVRTDLWAAEDNTRQVYSERFVFELMQNARCKPTSTEPESVLSGRTLDQVAAEEDEVAPERGRARGRERIGALNELVDALDEAPRAKLEKRPWPDWVATMLATLRRID